MFGLVVGGERAAVTLLPYEPVDKGGATSVASLSALGWYPGPVAESLAMLLREAGHHVSIVTPREYSNGS